MYTSETFNTVKPSKHLHWAVSPKQIFTKIKNCATLRVNLSCLNEGGLYRWKGEQAFLRRKGRNKGERKKGENFTYFGNDRCALCTQTMIDFDLPFTCTKWIMTIRAISFTCKTQFFSDESCMMRLTKSLLKRVQSTSPVPSTEATEDWKKDPTRWTGKFESKVFWLLPSHFTGYRTNMRAMRVVCTTTESKTETECKKKFVLELEHRDLKQTESQCWTLFFSYMWMWINVKRKRGERSSSRSFCTLLLSQ